MLKDCITDNNIKELVRLWNFVQRRIDMYVCIMQTIGDILIEEFSINEEGDISITSTSIEDAALEQVSVCAKFLLNGREYVCWRQQSVCGTMVS